MAKQYTPKGRVTIEDLTYDKIQAHVLAPEKNPLTPEQEGILKRVITCAQLFDQYPEDRMLIKLMRSKYEGLSDITLTRDIAYAKRLFVNRNSFNYDFWRIWQMNDVLELLRTAKQRNDLKMWNEAHKTLTKIIGEPPAEGQDLQRMQRNNFYIQINNGNGQEPRYVSIEEARDMPAEKLQEVISSASQVITEKQQLEQIFNS